MSGLTEHDFEVVTPEHLRLRFGSSDFAQRVTAVIADYAVIGCVLFGLWFLVFLVVVDSRESTASVLLAVMFVAAFLLRNFYFPWFEIRWQGRTPGKRWQGLRVISRDGGPLTPGQVFARNLTREFEIFVPLTVMLAPYTLMPNASGWFSLLGAVWGFALLLLPFLNRHRCRLGDLLAGTVVVSEPKAELLPDLADQVTTQRDEYKFTAEQLDLYGIHELQVLEDILRRDLDNETLELMSKVSAKIREKIDWPREHRVNDPSFLKSFYAAQRARLEQKMLLGERREKKVR